MIYTSKTSIQSCHGFYDMQHISSINAIPFPNIQSLTEVLQQHLAHTAHMTNESIIGMSRHIIGVKTITRQVYYRAKYNKYLTVVVNAYPLTSATPAPAIQLGTLPPANPKATNYTIAAKSTVGQKATSTQTCHDHHHRFRVN